ncbi:putative Teichoic acid glycerol-phosphate transferase [Hollandina sp. SP2]
MKGLKKIIRIMLSVFFLPFWYLELVIPRDKNVWVFGAWSGQKYSDNSRALYEFMVETYPEHRCVWLTNDRSIYQKLRSENKPAAMIHSLQGIQACLRASVAIISRSFTDLNTYCLNGIKQIWVWHGMPLKKIINDISYYTKQNKVKVKISGILQPWYKMMPLMTITSAPYFVPFLSTAFGLDENHILPTGLPRCDKLVNPKEEKLITRIRRDYPGCRILLYMPTFRTAQWTNKVFDPFAGYGFQADSFFRALEEENSILLYKPHYYDRGFTSEFTSLRFMQIADSDYDDLYCLLGQIDILMTDYSSVYFDFLSVRKPVILAPFDYDDYISTARDLYTDYGKTMAGIKAADWEAVLQILKEKKYYVVDEQTTLKYTEYNDGKSSEKLYKAISCKI